MTRIFNLTLIVILAMAQTAWAGTKIETRTVTFYMDGGASGRTSKVDDWTLNSGGITLHYANNNPSTNKIGLLSDNQMTTFDTCMWALTRTTIQRSCILQGTPTTTTSRQSTPKS